MKTRKQTSSSIDVLDFPDNVRKKPSMYMGPKGDQMAFVCIREVMDNAVDEHLAGRNPSIEVYASNKDNEYIIADKGEGIPVGKHEKTKQSTLTTVFTKLHAGGKLHATEGSYKVSRGTHGVGASATNALSEIFEVWTFRKQWYYQRFECGISTTKVIKKNPPSSVRKKLQYKYKNGTIIRVKLDKAVIRQDKSTKVIVPKSELRQWLRNTALMVSGLKVSCNFEQKINEWYNTKGIIAMLHSKLKKFDSPETFTKAFVFEQDEFKVALQWCNRAEDDGLTFYVNALPTPLGGEHEIGFVSALNDSLKPFLNKKAKFGSRDLLHGLVGVFNIDLPSPEFSGQTKEKLTTKCGKHVESVLGPQLKAFFAKNKSSAKRIIKRAIEVKKTKDEYRKLMTAVSSIKKDSRLKLSSKLAQSPKCKPENRELFIVEGDSANGSIKLARDTSFQESFPLTGKIANAIKAKPSELLNNKAIKELLQCIGYDFKAKDPLEKMRVKKGIWLLADPDPDGKHINVLLLTFFYKLMPELFNQGKIWICNAPLYSTYFKGKRYFGPTFKSVRRQLPDNAKAQIIRAKGWGELSPEQLEVIAMNPDTRYGIKVSPIKGKERKYFEALMGSDSLPRKQLLGLT